MNFNTFSALYGATIATSSFSGSGYTGSLVQAAQDLDYTLTITTGSNVGDPLQVTSSFGGLVTHSFTTSSFNERTSSVAISDATPFQSILVQGTVQGVNATTSVVFSSPILGTHITSSGNISSSGNITSNTLTSAGTITAGVGSYVITDNLRAHPGDVVNVVDSLNVNGSITASSHISSSGDVTSNKLTVVNTVIFPNLPTSDPGIAGHLYRDAEGNVKVSV